MVVHPRDMEWGECSNQKCAQPTPMDMVAIIIEDKVYCSPDCAKESLCDHKDELDRVTLHDPQYNVDREEIDIDSRSVDIHYEGPGNRKKMVDHCAELYSAPFRVVEMD